MRVAIQRETSIKRYARQWKINLVEGQNPDWNDLWEQVRPGPPPGRRISIEAFRRGERLDSSE